MGDSASGCSVLGAGDVGVELKPGNDRRHDLRLTAGEDKARGEMGDSDVGECAPIAKCWTSRKFVCMLGNGGGGGCDLRSFRGALLLAVVSAMETASDSRPGKAGIAELLRGGGHQAPRSTAGETSGGVGAVGASLVDWVRLGEGLVRVARRTTETIGERRSELGLRGDLSVVISSGDPSVRVSPGGGM